MSQSLSWIDPSAFSQALNRAGFDPARSMDPAGSGWFAKAGALPVGRKEPVAVVRPPARPPTAAPIAAEEAMASGTTEGAVADVGAPSIDPTDSSRTYPELSLTSERLDRRLESYMTWVEDCTSCKGLFIVDEEGLVLMERESDPNLVALSAYFLNLKDRIPDSLGTRSEGSIAIDLDDERVLHVVQADTRLGPHALGFTVESPLHRDLTQSFQESLASVFAAVG